MKHVFCVEVLNKPEKTFHSNDESKAREVFEKYTGELKMNNSTIPEEVTFSEIISNKEVLKEVSLIKGTKVYRWSA